MRLGFKNIESDNIEEINQIADWYFDQWKIPKKKTISYLSSKPQNDIIIFQTLMTLNKSPIGTGGLYKISGMPDGVDSYSHLSPWVSSGYIDAKERGKGFGEKLLNEIELEARRQNFDRLYLFTLIAESLCKRQGWIELERLNHEEKEIIIMYKKI